MSALLKLAENMRRALEVVALASGWLLVIMAFVTTFDVVARKFGLQLPYTKLQELEWHFHAAIFSLWMGYCYTINAHPRVDTFTETMSYRHRAWIELAGCLAQLSGAQFQPDGDEGRVSGPGPDGGSYRTFATWSDPDGNGWLMQEITTRLPGRIDAQGTAFASLSDLANAMRRAEAAHGEHEKRTGARDENWPDWYAEYMIAEQTGAELPT